MFRIHLVILFLGSMYDLMILLIHTDCFFVIFTEFLFGKCIFVYIYANKMIIMIMIIMIDRMPVLFLFLLSYCSRSNLNIMSKFRVDVSARKKLKLKSA